MVLAAFLFMKRMAEVTNVQVVTREFSDNGAEEDTASPRRLPPGVEVFEINGPFFFGATTSFQEQVDSVLGHPRVLILRMRNVPAIDSTGLHSLASVLRRSRAEGSLVLLTEVQPHPQAALIRSRILEEIGENTIVDTLDAAIERAREYLEL